MKIYFIGIGGIGVSALAQYYLANGAEVSGSDLVSSEIIDLLKEKGAKIKIGKHNNGNVPEDVDLVIYSPAVKKDNPELLQATNYKLQTKSYPEALGELTKKYFTIAISGAHGKSTTTSMIALILTKAGLDPSVIVGTKIREFGNPARSHAEGTNFRQGKSKYLVIEADEWNASFLNYWPKIIVLTNIEREHLDYYKDLNHILKTFKEYIGHLPFDGILVANKDDENILRILNPKSQTPNSNQTPNPNFQIQNYSLSQPETAQVKKLLQIPGEHNVSNALAALTVARILKVPDNVSFKALAQFNGTWRRFEITDRKIKNYKLQTINYKLINDYGHHPTEVRVTLKAVREKFPNKKIWCIFQPHQYQRTFNLFNDFVETFKKAPIDQIAIIDIYSVAGREKADIKRKVSSKKLVEAINKENIIYLTKPKIKSFLKKIEEGNVLLLMGAGDVYDLNLKL